MGYVGFILKLFPSCSDAEINPAAAHVIDRGGNPREHLRSSESNTSHQRAQSKSGRLDGQSSQHSPRVEAVLVLGIGVEEQVVRTPQRVEPDFLGQLAQVSNFFVTEAKLRLYLNSDFYLTVG